MNLTHKSRSQVTSVPCVNDAQQHCWGGLYNGEAYYNKVWQWMDQDEIVIEAYYQFCNEYHYAPKEDKNIPLFLNDESFLMKFTKQQKLDHNYFNIIKIMVKVTVGANYFGQNAPKPGTWQGELVNAVEQWAKILPIIRKNNVLWNNVQQMPVMGSKTEGVTISNDNKNMFVVSNSLLGEWDEDDSHNTPNNPAQKEFEYDGGWYWEYESKTGELRQASNWMPTKNIDLMKLLLDVQWVDVDTYNFNLRLQTANGEASRLLQNLEYIWLYFNLTRKNELNDTNNTPKQAKATNAMNSDLQQILVADKWDEVRLNEEQQTMVNKIKTVTERCVKNQDSLIKEKNELLSNEYNRHQANGKLWYKLSLGDKPIKTQIIDECLNSGIGLRDQNARIGYFEQIVLILKQQLNCVAQFISIHSKSSRRVSLASWMYQVLKPLAAASKHVTYLCEIFDLKQWFVLYFSGKQQFNNQNNKYRVQIPLFRYPKKLFYDATLQDVVFWFDLYVVTCAQWQCTNVYGFRNWWQLCNVFSQLYFWHSIFSTLV